MINFSLADFDKYDAVSLLNIVLDDLSESTVNRIKKDCANDGFQAYIKFFNKLDQFLFDNMNHANFLREITVDEFFYFTLIFPRCSIFVLKERLCELLYIDDMKFKRLMCRHELTSHFINNIDDEKLFVSSPVKLLLIALSATANNTYLNVLDEISFLKKVERHLENLNSHEAMCIRKLFSSRLSSLESMYDEPSNQSIKTNKIALFITGQSRGFAKALPALVNKFKSLRNVDVFVSTWENIGYTTFTPSRINRIFDTCVEEWIKEPKNISFIESQYDDLVEYILNSESKTIEQQYRTVFEGANDIKVNVKNDSEYPYNRMSNPEKMYYHNAFWVKTLSNHDWYKYDLIIKVRPDLLLKDSDLFFDRIKIENHICTEDSAGWIYREWGFGIGDQLLFGKPENMIQMLSLHDSEELATKVTSFLTYDKSCYAGHVNLGLCAWSKIHKCSSSKIKPGGLISPKKIKMADIEGFICRD